MTGVWRVRLFSAVCIVSLLSVVLCVGYNLTLDRVLGQIAPSDPSEGETSVVEDPWDALPETVEMDGEGLPILSDTVDVINLLLIGVDARSPGDPCRSDAMLLLSVNRKTRKIVLSSLLRDIYLPMEGHRDNRLNSAYAFGGAEYLCSVLRDNFNLDIRYYFTVDFTAFSTVVDILGGVDLYVTQEEVRVMNHLVPHLSDHLPMQSGTVHLNGARALAYVRDRSSANGDFDRTQRQRNLLNALFLKWKDSSVGAMLSAVDGVLPYVTTNMPLSELKVFVARATEFLGYAVSFCSVPTKGSFSFDTVRGMSVIRVNFKENISYLYEQIYT